MPNKFISIQYLRGLAAILVLASHALLYPLAERELAFGRLGWLGVILFFVISGFIMVVVTGKKDFAPVPFLRRRFIRIVPMYWGATMLAAGLALAAPQLFKSTVYDTGQLLLSLVFVPFDNPASGGIHPLYKLGWTLNYEVFFYLCFALLAFLGARSRVVWLTVAFTALAVGGVLFRPAPAFAEFYTSYMPLAFCAGAWLGLATLNGRIDTLPRGVIGAAAVLGLLGLVEGFAVSRSGLVEDGLAFAGLTVFASALVLLAIRLERHVPRVAMLELIGDASYSIYLVHIYAVAIVCGIAFRVVDPANPWASAAVATLAMAGGTMAGLLVYRFVEQPTLRLLSARFGGRGRAIPVAAPAE